MLIELDKFLSRATARSDSPIGTAKLAAAELLKIYEGFRSQPYDDATGKNLESKGYATIGYGRSLYHNPITKDEATEWLHAHIDRLIANIQTSPAFQQVLTHPDPAKLTAIILMAYQLGWANLMKFRQTIAHINKFDWHAAAAEAVNSKWAREYPQRAEPVHQLLTGKYSPISH